MTVGDAEYDALIDMIESNNEDIVAMLKKARDVINTIAAAHNVVAKRVDELAIQNETLEKRLRFVETLMTGPEGNQ